MDTRAKSQVPAYCSIAFERSNPKSELPDVGAFVRRSPKNRAAARLSRLIDNIEPRAAPRSRPTPTNCIEAGARYQLFDYSVCSRLVWLAVSPISAEEGVVIAIWLPEHLRNWRSDEVSTTAGG